LHPNAIAQAQQRLANAQEALDRLEAANTLLTVERAWSEYLIAVSAIYSKLELGSKSCGTSEAWFGQRKKQRKDDPLLVYLQQARHSEEHGIAHGVDAVETIHLILTKNKDEWNVLSTIYVSSDEVEESRLSNDADVEVRDIEGNLIESHTIITHAVQLLKIKNRGVIYNPAEVFLGNEIIDKSPLGVARLSIVFFGELVAEALNL
jgi:hypothetical protein